MTGGDVVFIEILIYWIISAALIFGMDAYAKRRLGKKTSAHMSLMLPKFITSVVVSVISIAIILYTGRNDIPAEVVPFLGAPYLGMWFYYIVNVFRRIRAEK